MEPPPETAGATPACTGSLSAEAVGGHWGPGTPRRAWAWPQKSLHRRGGRGTRPSTRAGLWSLAWAMRAAVPLGHRVRTASWPTMELTRSRISLQPSETSGGPGAADRACIPGPAGMWRTGLEPRRETRET